jgi:hypothetical protein
MSVKNSTLNKAPEFVARTSPQLSPIDFADLSIPSDKKSTPKKKKFSLKTYMGKRKLFSNKPSFHASPVENAAEIKTRTKKASLQVKKITSKLSLSRKKKPIYEQNISLDSNECATPVKNPHRKSKSRKDTPKTKNSSKLKKRKPK